MTGRHVQPDEAREIVKLRRKGLTIDAIAQSVGRSRKTVRRVLQQEGGTIGRTPPRTKRVTRRYNRIVPLLRQGLSGPQIAAELGLTPHQVYSAVGQRANWMDLGLIPLPDLAREIGVCAVQLRNACRRGELEHQRWGHRVMFTEVQAAHLRGRYAQHLAAEDVTGWLSSEQAARECGINLVTLLGLMRQGDPRVAGIRRVRVTGLTGRRFRYEPHSVAAAARNFPYRGQALEQRPAPGRLWGSEVAALAYRHHTTPTAWAELGAPHHVEQTRKGARLSFEVQPLLAWLESQPHVSYHRAAASIRRNLGQQPGRAA